MWDEESVCHLNIVQTLLPKPDRLRSRVAVALAAEKAAETGDHAHIFMRCGGRPIDDGPLENKTGQRLPVVLFTKDGARNVGNFTAEFGHVMDAPSYNHIDSETSFDGIGISELTFFDLAATLEGLVIDLDAPTFGIPSEFLSRVVERGDAARPQ